MERYQFSVYLGAVAVMVLVAYLVVAPKRALPVMTFNEQLTEANRQAKVASQLRAAEKGYLVEWKNGHFQKICDGGNGGIIICEALALGRKTAEYWAPKIERVIGPTDKDWGEIAFQYLRQ
ncbi:MAG: hypothetical protein UW81_C0023G0016 [Candidatus Giovannonibacteria bacterium GW2011_GWC2_44_9]|uniref:Uncharacterized protein n=3 Tax=Candidatus Giovannoniibacteriota TaxID=1752738 RepID=A0A0G1IWI6_9BACT|nr:MAG: hypothetical protein UW49_C0006G0016 [Candidatus Giovannonibacteria bacterium GW2011_GWB1_44_23]KKT63348.1 MAG: hypothetical protein UW57_C0008G0016 [Candidatus Giovannonibacteria bacterium GW2011_GWA1_44_29]KKT83238.1 MAG: hypothetical protein UW81_C0023G0016 [Candidatus Giovannonibacteria bacterium GW2011_GWC2_44_9]KKT91552.1 MAG: hypothetical protein UW93_C0005G0016 [Parcubacteria group bacterium GW2011_GWC1_45_13]